MSLIPRKKLVIVGDGGVGKKELIHRFSTGFLAPIFTGSFIENRIEEVEVDGKRLELSLWKAECQEEYDRMRPQAYERTDVFLLCFSVDIPESLDHVRTKWLPEILHFRSSRNVPYILVGCRMDRRGNQVVIDALRDAGLEFVCPEKGEAMATEIGALMYLECSSLTGTGVTEVFKMRRKQLFMYKNPPREGTVPPYEQVLGLLAASRFWY